MRPENVNIIKEHIVSGIESEYLNDKYFYLWSAFNIIYELERPNLIISGIRNPNEAETAKFCASKIADEYLNDVFDCESIRNLIEIEPIKNIRDLYRKGIENTDKFDNLVLVIHNDSNYKTKLNALVDLLYLIRCNLDHGFKSRKRERDQQILSLAFPLLEMILEKILTVYNINLEMK